MLMRVIGHLVGRQGRRASLFLVILAGFSLVARPAPATIAEQRARLPPPSECGEDPVTGIWKSHQYNPPFQDWEIFTLRIEREGEDGGLRGTMTNHSWGGTPQTEEPPPCGPGRFEWIVGMDAAGQVTGELDIRFQGMGQWRLDRLVCNRGPGSYNLDNFSGRIDPELNEFQSVNNDGGRAVNIPTVFRRIRCLSDATQAPRVQPRPPDFYPRTEVGCCGMW